MKGVISVSMGSRHFTPRGALQCRAQHMPEVCAKVGRWVVCPPIFICYWWRAASRGMQQLLHFAKVTQLVSGRPVAEPKQ